MPLVSSGFCRLVDERLLRIGLLLLACAMFGSANDGGLCVEAGCMDWVPSGPVRIIDWTMSERSGMARRARDGKAQELARSRTLNPRPEAVVDDGFRSSEFFDARDLVQVKYEMVRRVEADGSSVSAA